MNNEKIFINERKYRYTMNKRGKFNLPLNKRGIKTALVVINKLIVNRSTNL